MARVLILAMKCKIVNLPVLAKNPRGTAFSRLKNSCVPKVNGKPAVPSGR
jgi:hypothetical protein